MPSFKEVFSEQKINKKQDLKGPDFPRLIVAHSNGKFRYGGRKVGAYRIQRTNPNIETTPEEIENILDKCDFKVIEILPPGTPGAASGKFHTYVLRHDEIEFLVVFGQGKNKGQRYEDVVLDDLKSSQKAKSKKKRSKLYKALLDAFNLKPSDVSEFKKVSGRGIKRPISKEISDVGSLVSDINIILKNGRVIHISLKDVNGTTFTNSGYTGGFVSVMGKDEKPYFRPGEHPLDELLLACGVDKQKAANGLNDYVRERVTKKPFRDVEENFNEKTVKQYLASAYGYGYWYVRPTRVSQGGGYQIVNIGTPKDAIDKVGDINNITVTYPYWTPKMTSKQITVKIDTDTAFYKIEVRNSHRRINPNEFKIKLEYVKS